MKALSFTLLLLISCSALFASQERKTLTLRLSSPNGSTDVTTLYFDQGISPAYDVHQDAAYIFSGISGVPEIYSYTLDKVACRINGCGTLASAAKINLGYNSGITGLFTITGIASNFDATTIIRLIDTKLADTVDLRQNFLMVALDTDDITTNRFQILVSSSVKYSSLPSNCANSGGSISVSPDSTITWSQCQLIDSSNQQVIDTYYDVTGPITFTGLAEGHYEVIYTYGDYTATNYFYLNGNFVVASIGVPTQPIYTNEDVVFDALTTNADHFNWDFGDSTLIIGVGHPTQRYLTPGIYTVNLYAYNDLGCSASAQATVTVLAQENTTGINETSKKDITVFAEGVSVNVNMNGVVLSDNARVQIYNLLGQSIKSVPLNTQVTNLTLDNEANGYYLVSVRNSTAVTTKRVFIAK